jgi:cytoskeletal protein CcmA (bactofilin family)
LIRAGMQPYSARTIKTMDPNMSSSTGGKNVLSSDVEIKGNVKFAGELQCDGKIEGEIVSEGLLTLGETATINGNINAGIVVVRGKVNGNINAKEKIEIKTKAEIFGDIKASKLSVEEGVTFVGRAEVNPNKITPSASKPTEPPKPPTPGVR